MQSLSILAVIFAAAFFFFHKVYTPTDYSAWLDGTAIIKCDSDTDGGGESAGGRTYYATCHIDGREMGGSSVPYKIEKTFIPEGTQVRIRGKITEAGQGPERLWISRVTGMDKLMNVLGADKAQCLFIILYDDRVHPLYTEDQEKRRAVIYGSSGIVVGRKHPQPQ